MITIGKAQSEDFKAVQRLFRKMFDIYFENQNVEYPYTEHGINYLEDRINKGFAYAAKENDLVVGFLTGSINKAIEFKTYDQYGFIENMYVLEEYRKKSIGKMLINEFISDCKDLDIEFIHTDSDANQAMINFYTGLGFKISGVNYIMKIKKDI